MRNLSLLFAALIFIGCVTTTTKAPEITTKVEPSTGVNVVEQAPAAEPAVTVQEPLVQMPSTGVVTTASGMKYTSLEGYYIKNTAMLPNDENYFIATSDKIFSIMFGVAKTMTNVITVPDFSKNMIIAIVLKPSKKDADIVIKNMTVENDQLIINYEVLPKGELQYTSTIFKAVEIERPSYIKAILFQNTAAKESVKVPFVIGKSLI